MALSTKNIYSAALLFVFSLLFVGIIYQVSTARASGPYYVATTGSDTTGTGSIDMPFASITKALSVVSDGDTVIVGDGTYTPTTIWNITKSITLKAQNVGGTTLQPNVSQASIISVNIANGGTFTLSGFVLDGLNNASTTQIVRLVNQASAYTFNSNDNVYKNYALYAIVGSSPSDRAVVTSSHDTFIAYGARTGIYRPTVLVGGTSITNDTFNVTGVAASSGLAWAIKASALGVTFNSNGNTIFATTTYTAGETYATSLYNTPGTFANDTITLYSTTTSSCTPIFVSQVPGAPLLAENGTITNETTTNNCAGGGHSITIGTDGDPGIANRNFINNWTISGSHLYASTAARAAGVHGILFGWESGGRAFGNYAKGIAYTWLSKGMGGTLIYGSNIDVNSGFASMYIKGSQAGGCTSYINNTSYISNGVAYALGSSVEPYTLLVPAFCTIANNIMYGNSLQFVRFSQGTVLPSTISKNDYYSTTTPRSNAWSYYVGSVQQNIGTLAGWQGTIEPTALSVDPQFTAAPTNFKLSATSPLAAVGVNNAVVVNDYDNYPFGGVSVGAYQVH